MLFAGRWVLTPVGEVLKRPRRIWSSLPNLARATLLNTARTAAAAVAVAAGVVEIGPGEGRHRRQYYYYYYYYTRHATYDSARGRPSVRRRHNRSTDRPTTTSPTTSWTAAPRRNFFYHTQAYSCRERISTEVRP